MVQNMVDIGTYVCALEKNVYSSLERCRSL